MIPRGATSGMNQGTKLALSIVSLWVAGLCYFIAFLSGKVPSLTTGTDSTGNSQGPGDISQLTTRLAANVQTLANQGQAQASGGQST